MSSKHKTFQTALSGVVVGSSLASSVVWMGEFKLRMRFTLAVGVSCGGGCGGG